VSACHAQPVEDNAAAPAVAKSDCSNIGSSREREACLLALSKDQCKAIGPACTSLQNANVQEARLAKVEQEILARARARYASYAADDAEYLNDLQKSFTSSATAWREYRDAYCQAEPFVQGMSRDEQESLGLECRSRLTQERTEQLVQLAKAIP
jgi:hypothetical protein